MKIIEALKEQKKIQNSITRNCTAITNYACKLSSEKPIFESDEIQKQEVLSLIQSNQDLTNRFLWLKRCIDHTNLTIKVEFDGIEYTITDLLNLKRSGINFLLSTHKALNDSQALRRLSSMKYLVDKQVQVELLYDEKTKNNQLDRWQTLYDNIDARLEVINATTDLVELDTDLTKIK